jgi:hypothetical protein
MTELLDIPDTIAPGSSADDEANQPVENFDTLGESVELSDAIHDAPTLEQLARVVERRQDWEESNGIPIDSTALAHQLRELDHLMGLDPSDEVQARIDTIVNTLPALPDLQDTVVRIMNRGEN